MTTEEELDKLRKDYKKLKQKLNGVRKARLRDKTKANARLHNCVETYNMVIQRIVDRAAETRANRLEFMFWYLSNNWIQSGKFTPDEWEDAYSSALNAYTGRYERNKDHE